jgi:hypothetical protein
MKRFAALVLVLVILGSTTSVAYADKHGHEVRATFYDTAAVCNPYTLGAATRNKVEISGPDWRYALQFEVRLGHLVPKTSYEFWVRDLTGYTGPIGPGDTANLGWYRLRTFKTDRHGEADFTVRVRKSYLPSGTYPIQVAIDLPGCTKLATQEAVFTLVVP